MLQALTVYEFYMNFLTIGLYQIFVAALIATLWYTFAIVGWAAVLDEQQLGQIREFVWPMVPISIFNVLVGFVVFGLGIAKKNIDIEQAGWFIVIFRLLVATSVVSVIYAFYIIAKFVFHA